MNAAFSLQVEQSLRNLGFTRYEVQSLVYLVKVKKCTAKKLSRENTIPFNLAQAILANLERRGLVSLENKSDGQYTFAGKEAFQRWLKEEQSKHQDIYEQAGKDMEQLFMTHEETQWQPEVLFYEGEEGIREIYDDMIQTGEDIYTCTDLVQVENILGKAYIEKFIETRNKKDMKLYTIRSKESNQSLKSEGRSSNKLREIKVIEDLELDGEIRIYGDQLSFITFEKDRLVGFVFKSSSTSKLFKQLFKVLWKKIN